MSEVGSAADAGDAVAELASSREELRDAARAQLGVTGEAKAEPFRLLARRHGLSYYPLVALALLEIVDTFQGYGFTVLAPDISRTLGISIGAIGLATGLRGFAQAASPLGIARLAQSRNRAVLCLVTAFAWGAITLLTGFVTSLIGLIFILVIDGVSTGSVTALHAPLVMDNYPPAARVRALSAYSSASFLGNTGAQLMIALLAGPLGLTWRGTFLIMGLVSLAVTFVCLRLRDPGYGRFDTELVRATVRDDTRPGFQLDAEDTALGFWEILHRLMMIPTVRRVYFGFGVFGLLAVPLGTFLSYFLEQRWNMDASSRGFFFAYYFGASVLGLFLFGSRGERLFRRAPALVLRLAAALLGVLVFFIAAGGLVPSFGLMLAMFGVSGAALGPLFPLLSVALLSILPAQMRAHGQGLSGMFIAVGTLLGAFFFTGIEARYGIAGSIVAVTIPGAIGAWIVATAGTHVEADLDHMIDEIVEEEQIKELTSAGRHLPMLACRKINFSYGSLQVLFDVDVAVDDGEMVALLGVNGAGKSTLLRVISGVGLPQSGSVRLGGQDITYLDAERRTKLGITQIPGGRAVFGPLTVVDNLRTFGYTLGRNKRLLDQAIDDCFDTFPRLAERRHNVAATLSGGEQQMLGLCKALILKPRLLVIDELSLGLAPIVVGQLLEMVQQINAAGSAVVLVEQSVNIALNLVDHAYFMEKGEIRFDGPAGELLARDDLLRAVFLSGTSAAAGEG